LDALLAATPSTVLRLPRDDDVGGAKEFVINIMELFAAPTLPTSPLDRVAALSGLLVLRHPR
jgi:hypothetical protein